MNWITNFIFFQIGWFACVLGGANGMPWLGVVMTGLALAFHLWQAAQPRLELILALLAGGLGGLLDSLPVALGWLTYTSGMFLTGAAPSWIIAMWMLFATTLNVSLRWLKGRYVLAALLGAAAGPLAYYAGAKLGGVTLLEPAAALSLLALIWAVAMPTLLALASRFDGMAEPEPSNLPLEGCTVTERSG